MINWLLCLSCVIETKYLSLFNIRRILIVKSLLLCWISLLIFLVQSNIRWFLVYYNPLMCKIFQQFKMQITFLQINMNILIIKIFLLNYLYCANALHNFTTSVYIKVKFSIILFFIFYVMHLIEEIDGTITKLDFTHLIYPHINFCCGLFLF